MRQKLIVGNWKMNASLRANAALLEALLPQAALLDGSRVQLAVAPPAPYLAQVQALLAQHPGPIALAAQDVCESGDSGAYTGQWSAAMLQDFGVRYVIVGHSERRKYQRESNGQIAFKALSALDSGITPIVCLGENLAQRYCGETEAVVTRQLAAVTEELGARSKELVLAYEPVWAIGTGAAATPQQAQAVHALLRAQLAAQQAGAVPILYGGSMNAGNAAQLLGQPDIDGGLIGGAALDAAAFAAIAAAAAAAS